MKLFLDAFRHYGRFCSIIGNHRIFLDSVTLKGAYNLKCFQKEILFDSRCFASASNNALSEKSVKVLLDHATKVYECRDNTKSELAEVLEIREVELLIQERLKIKQNIKSLEELVKNDKEMKILAQEEFTTYVESLSDLDERLLQEILSHLGRENCADVVFEISAGVGGQESMIFANDLLEMYCNHFSYLGYTFTLMEKDVTPHGGIRHASLTISGRGVYEKFRHEIGVHRVQRIPVTETLGRIHTSVVSVVIFPQPSDIEVKLEDKDLKIETKRASGAGGQHVNKTDSAVRIVHIPSGVAVECQNERSQIRNKSLAMVKLRTKIYQKILNDQMSSTNAIRRKQMGFKSRNERIRTYNFLQDRVTDHRLQDGTMHDLNGFMEGGSSLEKLQRKLQEQFQRKILTEVIEEIQGSGK